MSISDFLIRHLHDALAGMPLERVLEVLAAQTQCTAILFDEHKQVIAGPVAGNALIQAMLTQEAGRAAVIDAHRLAIPQDASTEGTDPNQAASPLPAGEPELLNPLRAASLDHFAASIIHSGRRLGALSLGDRPRKPLDGETIQHLAAGLGLDSGALQAAAGQVTPWTAEQASAARDLLALTTELLATLDSQHVELGHRIEELTAVYNMVGLLAGTLDPQEILDKTARMVCAVMRVKACSIRMLDEATGELTIKAVHNLSNEYLNKGPVKVSENSIDSAAMAGEMVHIADAPGDPRTRYPEQARQEGIVSGLVCGLIFRGKAVGVLRAYTGEPHVFTPFEESLLRAVASQAAALVINARLLKEALEAQRYAHQLAYAGAVQRRMIPQAPPSFDKAEIAAVYRPIFEVGGDYFDFLPFSEGNLGIVIADVSGKGVPASLLMASLRSAFRGHAYHTYHLDKIIAEVNEHMCRDTSAGEFATAFYGVLTPDGRRLTYCNAGHDPPMLLRDGQIQYLETGGMALGVTLQSKYDRGLVELRSGDVLFLYTDGTVEAMNFNSEAFGRDRLADSLIRYAQSSPQMIAKNILWDIRRFRGLADRTDDLTMVVVKIK
ncbi:MAG: PP2C family protein-serine/threonine phosphatase [Phycisphaerales bacterium]|nr:PP2C family protein-serine/threonine phosphatase [Phycisphaerales bacterium]